MDNWRINISKTLQYIVKEQKKSWLILLYSVFISYVFVINMSILSWYIDLEVNMRLLFFFGIIYLVYFILNITFGVIFFRIKSREQDAKNQTLYNKSLEAVNNELKDIKQNFDHSIISIYNLTKNGHHEKLKELITETKSEYILFRKANIYMCEGIQNAGILGLIITKLDHMKSIGLDAKLMVHNEIIDIDMKIHHLCEILGIILDNAIEAAIDTEEKHINLVISNDKDNISFIVENSTNNHFDIVKAFNLGWSTKGNQRGMGLWIAKSIINKYKNVMLNTTIEKNRVKQELIIVSK